MNQAVLTKQSNIVNNSRDSQPWNSRPQEMVSAQTQIFPTPAWFCYLMNQTLGGPLVRALRARAGILLLINQRILHRESFWYEMIVFESWILYIFMSHVPTTKVIIFSVDAFNSLSNCIFINIYYNPISRILRGEIHRRKMWVRFSIESKFSRFWQVYATDCPYLTFYII